ncbi:MAG: sigma 54-interacting transcriptional regulator [Emergencia sp.]|nr:sigma 54-interacting transcriptional regulator [Emergencia sp.]
MRDTKMSRMVEESMPVLEAMAEAISITDTDGNQVYKNQLYERMISRGNTEIVADEKDVVFDQEVLGKVTVYHDISEINRLKRELDKLNQKLRKVEVKYTFKDIIGKDPEMQRMLKTAQVAAATPATIMLRGESGTGKEIIANAIHNASKRRNEKFIKINCSSIPEELLESELFGYKEGAFTGARRGGKKGLFQEADGGTLFLDEIGDVSSKMQVKLLRVLQEKEIMPVGSTEAIDVDVRIICATNKPLEEMIERGEFREDLYYRLNVFPLFIPPLRERKEDIGLISQYLLNQYNEFYDRSVNMIEPEAVELLKTSDWPGNVRELENVLSRALINLNEKEEKLSVEDVEGALRGQDKPRSKKNDALQMDFPENLNDAIKETEKYCLLRAIKRHDGDKNKAANDLGIPLRTLYYKCKNLGI